MTLRSISDTVLRNMHAGEVTVRTEAARLDPPDLKIVADVRDGLAVPRNDRCQNGRRGASWQRMQGR